jgi:hypothetical protein
MAVVAKNPLLSPPVEAPTMTGRWREKKAVWLVSPCLTGLQSRLLSQRGKVSKTGGFSKVLMAYLG